MFNFWQNLKTPILVLAPMAGYTESPFRRIIKEIEPSTILVSELVSVEAICHKNEKTMRLIEFQPCEKNYYCVQLFGNNIDSFIKSAKIIEDLGVDGIDINMGCPSPKVVGSGHGSALLKNPVETTKMIEKLVKSTKLPISIKMRLGFFDDENLIKNAKMFESVGITCLAIHGRTTKQKFTGKAHWEKIYQVKENLKIPVIGNGDITSAEIAQKKLKNLDGIMIGRTALRNPWIFKQCREIFDGRKISPLPTIKDRLEFFRQQAQYSIELKNEKWAMIELRKHFAHFVRGVRGASKFRDKLIRINSYEEMETIFREIIDSNSL